MPKQQRGKQILKQWSVLALYVENNVTTKTNEIILGISSENMYSCFCSDFIILGDYKAKRDYG